MLDYIDERLNGALSKRVEEHLNNCIACCGELEAVRQTLEEVKANLYIRAQMVEPPDNLWNKVSQEVKETKPKLKVKSKPEWYVPIVLTPVFVMILIIIIFSPRYTFNRVKLGDGLENDGFYSLNNESPIPIWLKENSPRDVFNMIHNGKNVKVTKFYITDRIPIIEGRHRIETFSVGNRIAIYMQEITDNKKSFICPDNDYIYFIEADINEDDILEVFHTLFSLNDK